MLESSLKAVPFSKVFQTFKALCSFDAPFSSILKKYRSFATVHYSLVATSAVFAKLKHRRVGCGGDKGPMPPPQHFYRGALPLL